MARPPRVLYLSTHGQFALRTRAPVADPLLRCGLEFARGEGRRPGKEKQRESLPWLLTGAEVLAVPHRGTELVVLSACQSGTGLWEYGQSRADLRHAFHLAGARAVVASLWAVEDRSTRDVMVAFVESLARTGMDQKAEALRQAQRRKIEALLREDFHSHPFYWAAFSLSGS
jgi:CHAT domain-containing protein